MVCNIFLSQRDKGRQAGNGARQRTATALQTLRTPPCLLQAMDFTITDYRWPLTQRRQRTTFSILAT